MAEMLGFCPVISRSGPEKPLYGTKNRSQSPWNRPIWGAAREFDFRDEFAADSPLQQRVRCEPVSRGNSPFYVREAAVSAGLRAGASGTVGRDAQDAATSGLRAVISLSG